MEELYYWGDKKGYTWRQLLYKISKYTDNHYQYLNYVDNYNRRLSIDNFFSDYSHNDNDGIWRKERRSGRYLFSAYYSDIKTRQMLYKHYYAPDYIVNVFYPKRNRIIDSYGRIIPSGLLKKAVLDYIPREEDNPNPHKPWKRWHFGRKWRKEHTSRFKGDHGFLGNECRQNMIFKTEEKDIFEEFNVRVKYSKSRASDVKHMYIGWDSRDTYGGIKRSWKRSKKKKQWM